MRIPISTDHNLGSLLAVVLWLGGMGLLLYRHTDFFAKVRQEGLDRRFWRVTYTNPIAGWEFALAILGTIVFGGLIAWQALA